MTWATGSWEGLGGSSGGTLGLTLVELRAKAKAAVGRRDDLEDTTVTATINEAYQEVAYAAQHATLEAVRSVLLEADTYSYSLDDDIIEITSAVLDDPQGGGNTPLRFASSEELLELRSSATGMPTQYSTYAGTIEFFPTPGDAYIALLRCRVRPSDLSLDTDRMLLSLEWQRAVHLKTEEKLFYFIGNYAAAALAQQRYLSYVASIDDDRAKRQKDNRYFGARFIY